MSWAGLASNQWIAYSDVQDAIANNYTTVIGTDPGLGSNQWITIDQLVAWVASTSGSGSQWATKSDVNLVYVP
jgi:hypothetical protein